MSMISANTTTVHRDRTLRWAAIIGGMLGAFATGLLTAKTFSPTVEHPHAAINAIVNQPAAASAPAAFEIVPSPVIEAHPQLFYGTGDGNGSWADSPRP
jgi:hypothetical protein